MLPGPPAPSPNWSQLVRDWLLLQLNKGESIIFAARYVKKDAQKRDLESEFSTAIG